MSYRSAFASGVFPDGLDRLGVSYGQEVPVDAYAIADEVGRSALQIARQDHAEAHRARPSSLLDEEQRPSFLPPAAVPSAIPAALELV